MAEAERNQEERKLKRKTLPKGTSEYQVHFLSIFAQTCILYCNLGILVYTRNN